MSRLLKYVRADLYRGSENAPCTMLRSRAGGSDRSRATRNEPPSGGIASSGDSILVLSDCPAGLKEALDATAKGFNNRVSSQVDGLVAYR